MTKSGSRKSSSTKSSSSRSSSRKPSSRNKPSSSRSSSSRSSSSRTSTRKSSSSRTSSAGSRTQSSSAQRTSPLVAVLGIVIIVALGGYYLLTGADPLHLFEPDTPPTVTPAITVQAPTPTRPSGPTPTPRRRSSWWEVYFTDPSRINDPNNLSGSIPEKLIAFIDEATDTIHVAAFEFNLTPVAQALIRAKQRGVEVQWVTDDENGIEADEEPDHGQFAMLEGAGIQVKDDGRSALMHNKFWVFDNQTVWTGSTNITQNGNFRNNNNVLVIHSTEVATIFEREFQEMWAGQFGPTSPSTVDLQSAVVGRTPVQVLFAAEDKAISHLVPLVEGAKSSLHIMAFSFTHDALGEAVLQRAKRGVDVQGIFETRGSETEFSELTLLYCAKVPVRQDGNPGTFHHKVIVVDEETLITGSLNFSNNADESNDENVVVIQSKTIAGRYIDEFERRWKEATDPDPADIKCN
jgi:phosphatidylserine/phosphatidylglycerophosphate/cardiolipin synthase-like enzyme